MLSSYCRLHFSLKLKKSRTLLLVEIEKLCTFKVNCKRSSVKGGEMGRPVFSGGGDNRGDGGHSGDDV